MYLFDLASTHMSWLADRQAVTAANVANADTPGYRARAIAPFESYIDNGALDLATTDPAHMTAGGGLATAAASERPGNGWDTAHSGNNVALEQELMTAGATTRMMTADIAVMRSFQRMILSSVKV